MSLFPPIVLSPTKRKLVELFWELGVINIDLDRGFLTVYHDNHPDAPRSPYYLNLRTKENPKPGPLTTEAVELVAEIFEEMVREIKLRRGVELCGIPNAADPFVERLVARTNRPRFVLQKTADRNFVATFPRPPGLSMIQPAGFHHELALFDDVLSEAGSKLRAIRAITIQDAEVENLFVLVDREQGGREELRRRASGLKVHTAIDITMIFGWLCEQGAISENDRNAILAYPTILKSYQAQHPD